MVRRASVDLAALTDARLDPDRPYADEPSFVRSRLFNRAPDLVLSDRHGGVVRIGLGGEWLRARPLFQRLPGYLASERVTSDERTRANVEFLTGAGPSARTG